MILSSPDISSMGSFFANSLILFIVAPVDTYKHFVDNECLITKMKIHFVILFFNTRKHYNTIFIKLAFPKILWYTNLRIVIIFIRGGYK